MVLFPDRLVSEMQRLPGGKHSFLAQVCSDGGRRHRLVLETLVEQVGEPLAGRLGGLLGSLDNRRFFQGYAELVTAVLLSRGAYRVHELLGEAPLLRTRRLSGSILNVSVLSFIHKSRPIPDRKNVERLVAALERVAGHRSFFLVVHRWLPHDLDPEPVRRAVELWLAQVERGQWTGRYATYQDDGISLEFGLLDGRLPGGNRVGLVIGPFLCPATLAAVEPRLLRELERYRLGEQADEPLLLACVADQPWHFTRGYLREFLYGKADRMEMFRDGEEHGMEFRFSSSPAPALFRDPLYRTLRGVLWIARDPLDPTVVLARSYLNPFVEDPLDPQALPGPVCARERDEAEGVVLRWRRQGAERIRLL